MAAKPRSTGRPMTLASVLEALEGTRLIFELRNDTTITGTLAAVDPSMNAIVDDALWQPVQGPATLYPFLYLRGNQLRFVHLPKSFDPAAALQAHKERQVAARVQGTKALLAARHGRLAKGDGGASPVDDARTCAT